MATTNKRKQRGAHRREDCVFIGAWIPNGWIAALDQMVVRDDSDRSKIIRKAIEQKIQEAV